MRVLLSALSCNPQLGSEPLVGYKVAEALARRHSVSVISALPTEVPDGAIGYPLDVGSCNFNDVGATSLMRFELRQFPKAWWLTRREKFDVVHRVTPSAIQNASFLSALKVPFVIGPLLASDHPGESFLPYLGRATPRPRHGRLHPSRIPGGLARRAVQKLARWNTHLRSARKIIVGSQMALRHVPAEYRDRCELIPYAGVEHGYFVPPPERDTNRPLRLLYVGRVTPYKGLEFLLRAMAIARKECEFELRVVGACDEPYALFCRELAAELNLQDRVEFSGVVPRRQLPDVYQQADVFCFPTIETYGIALLEAMSCQCAVITSDINGPKEIVGESAGIKIPMRLPEQYIHEFAEAIVTLERDSSLRTELGRQARRHVVEHHDWGRIQQRLLDIYERL